MINQIKAAKIRELLKDFDENKSICSACDACELLIEEIKAGRIML